MPETEAIKKIKEWLKKEERSVSWLSKKIGCSNRQHVDNWLKGHNLPSPKFRKILKDMKVFGIKDDWV